MIIGDDPRNACPSLNVDWFFATAPDDMTSRILLMRFNLMTEDFVD